ncbi:MAG TPA: mycofactocin-coupled SDR family oxidoreductase [Acidimicrobiales bacterium]|nr:mycofactocin-coupled SDR family oxidoreductase [Acidimicrobiales bacterium]
MGKLDGRVALVTGAGRGQGRAHALALAASGAAVVALDVDGADTTAAYPLATASDLARTVELVEQAGGRAHAITADIRSSDEVDAAVSETLELFGRVDVLVANAAICACAPFGELDDEHFSDVIATNLTGTFHCLRAVVGPMTAQQFGRIVVVSSMTGRRGNPNLAHYCASKYAVIGLAKSLALEVAASGVTVNVMCPTSVDTTMVHNEANYRLFCPDLEHPTIDDVRPRFASLNPMGIPWIDPDVFTAAVLYLVEDDGFVSGATLEVGAGISALLT